MKIALYGILLFFALLYATACIFLYFWQEKVLFLPKKLPADYTFRFPNLYKELTLTNPQDQAKIHHLWFKVSKPKGLVLFFHGNEGSLARWGNMAHDFCKHGYDVLMQDYRQYGKSEGELTEANLMADAQILYAFARQAYPPQTQLIIYGRSIGTGIATYLAAHQPANKLILETPYFSMIDLVQSYAPLVPVTALLRFPLRSDIHAQGITCPVYILHGTADETVPYTQGKKLALSLGNRAKFYTIEAGKHNDLATFESYQNYLRMILEE